MNTCRRHGCSRTVHRMTPDGGLCESHYRTWLTNRRQRKFEERQAEARRRDPIWGSLSEFAAGGEEWTRERYEQVCRERSVAPVGRAVPRGDEVLG